MKKSCAICYDKVISDLINTKKVFSLSKTYYNIIYILKNIYSYGMDIEPEIRTTDSSLEIRFIKNDKTLSLVFSNNGEHKFYLNEDTFQISELYKIIAHMLKNSTYKGYIHVRRKTTKSVTSALGK